MPLIFHITPQNEWYAGLARGRYEAPSLKKEGYIHCSTRSQVVDVANHIFKGTSSLVLLCIDRTRLLAKVEYENLFGGDDLFPHIYGPLNVDAVVGVVDFPPGPHGTFALPPAIVELG